MNKKTSSAFKLNKETYFLEGPHSRLKDFGFTLEIMFEFIKGFRTLHFVGPCITVFGSARFTELSPYYQKAVEVGAEITKLGFGVLTGGGPGIMEAANRGAADVLHERNALADFRADEATHGQHGEHRAHVTGGLARRGKLAGGDERTEHDRQQHQHRHGENAHAQLHEFPPAMRPEAGVRCSRGRRGGRTGFLGHMH